MTGVLLGFLYHCLQALLSRVMLEPPGPSGVLSPMTQEEEEEREERRGEGERERARERKENWFLLTTFARRR